MRLDRADATGSLVSSIILYPVLWMFGRCCARRAEDGHHLASVGARRHEGVVRLIDDDASRHETCRCP